MSNKQRNNKVYLRIIYVISIFIPVAVIFIALLPKKSGIINDWMIILPGFHAVVNGLTVCTLVVALISVRNGNMSLHRFFMFVSLFLGMLFLCSYITYHLNVDSVKFGDLNFDGKLSEKELDDVRGYRIIYLIVLVSHILFSIFVVPFVLLSFYYALTNQIERHKKIVKFTYPMWMYVSVTGVIVYFLISPYYS